MGEDELYSIVKLCQEFQISVGMVANRYGEKQRYYHTMGHIETFFRDIPYDETSTEWNIWVLAALFHDIVYDPKAVDGANEKNSIEVFKQLLENRLLYRFMSPDATKAVAELIWSTRPSNTTFAPGIETQFNRRDRMLLTLDMDSDENARKVIQYEEGIQKEYQWVPWPLYREKRLEFLNSQPSCETIRFLKAYVKAKVPRVGIYAGSFNPWHKGHLSVLRCAEQQFDKVIVAVGLNPAKNAMAQVDGRKETLAQTMLYHQVESFDTLLTTYMQQIREVYQSEPTLVRGLRTDTDFKFEETQLRFMQDMDPELKVIFVAADKAFEHVSSSSVKAVGHFDEEAAKKYLVDTKFAYNLEFEKND